MLGVGDGVGSEGVGEGSGVGDGVAVGSGVFIASGVWVGVGGVAFPPSFISAVALPLKISPLLPVRSPIVTPVSAIVPSGVMERRNIKSAATINLRKVFICITYYFLFCLRCYCRDY